MFEVPQDIDTVLTRRGATIRFLIIINAVCVVFLTYIFLITYGIDFRIERFSFSFRVAFLPIILLLLYYILIRLFGLVFLVIFSYAGYQVSMEEPEKKFGKYKAGEILELVDNQCKKMNVTSVKRVYVIESQNSNAMTMDLILFEPYRYSVVVIFSSVLTTMNTEEVEAVIGHEVAHVKNKDSWYLGLVGSPTFIMAWVMLILIINLPLGAEYTPNIIITILITLLAFYICIRPVVKRMIRYGEYYADFTSAKVNGLIPMSNALIKLGQRNDMLVAFQGEFQRRFRLDSKLRTSTDFYKRLKEELKDVLDPDEAVEVARKLVKEFGGEEIDENKIEEKGSKLLKPELIDWRDYDNIVKNYNLEYEELDNLIKDLKDSPQSRLFKHASTTRTKMIFMTHPRIRDRLIFLWDSRKDEYKKQTYDMPIFISLKEFEKLKDRTFICPICMSRIKVKRAGKGSKKYECPHCGIPGELR